MAVQYVARDPASALPRKFIIARWRYDRVPAGREWEGDPLAEASYDTRERLVAEVWSGEIVHMTQAIEVDLEAGAARDITDDIFRDASEHSFVANDWPHAELAEDLDARGFDYLTQEEIEGKQERAERERQNFIRAASHDARQLGVGRFR